MSIILKGIDMPKANEIRMIAITQSGAVFFTTVKDGETSKSRKAEAIQIPTPHGRLIDEKQLKEALTNPITDETSSITWGDIDNAPTILETEGRTYTIQADSETVGYKNGENQF